MKNESHLHPIFTPSIYAGVSIESEGGDQDDVRIRFRCGRNLDDCHLATAIDRADRFDCSVRQEQSADKQAVKNDSLLCIVMKESRVKMRNPGLIIGVVVLIVLLVLLLGGMNMMGFGGMMGGYSMHGFNNGFGVPPWGGLMMLLFWGLLIGGIVLVVVSLTRNSRAASTVAPPPTYVESPLDILTARYARGEITKEQFNEIKKDLEG